MDYTDAREAIIKKFTNYRYANNDAAEGGAKQISRKAAANALADFQAVHKGKELFKVDMAPQIAALRDRLKASRSQLSQIGAYQMAVKQLWEKQDQAAWEELAAAKVDDIFE